ncbi:pirin family protein [Agrobacterium sp. ES01]|uniref:pirin family protein n=1 Tax=Agrobacterium sp. ES01 TaxID=3420714 RepID=UPI003D0A704A
MILIHENMNRGVTRQGWLNSYHTFSFGGFHDPNRMGFGPLRVINEDWIVPGSGFAEHAHDNMDILTIVLEGALRHKDTLGNVSDITAGEMQLMSAGNGLRHSEMNASDTETAHVLQIWMIPETRNPDPLYQQAKMPEGAAARDWTLIASGPSGDAPLRLLSDSRVWIANPRDGDISTISKASDRLTFVHLIEGLAQIEGETIRTGDGLQIGNEAVPDIHWLTDGKALMFDLPR